MPLTIRLLGSPEVSFGGRPLSFRTRKVLALLVYLVVERGMHSRDSLMTLLWPETEAQKAAVTLRGTLSRLRRALQPAGDVLITEAGKVGFDFSGAVDLDLDWLATAVLSETAPDALAPILEIDRDEFLAGFSLPDAPDFDTWAAIERQACQRRVETIYDRLTQHQLQMGSSAAAIETAVRWMARAPLNETACRRLMAAQVLSGDRPAALKTYAQCQLLLLEELGIEPAKETADLAERISDREFRFQISDSGLPGKDSAAGNRQADMPFVGRADEHGQLVQAFRQTVAAGARVFVVIGAGGVGKTRLVHAFLQWAALDNPGVDIWQGRAFEMGGRLPYEPIIEALRLRLEQENAPEDLLDDVWLAELSQLMPELRGRYPDLPPPMIGDANFVRSRLFAAVATLGSALAARQPAVFVLDDVQWADADTLDMVHYAARRWAESGAPILLLLTVGQESFAADSALREWLSRLDRDVPVSRLLLDSLNGTAVRQLVANLESARHLADSIATTETARQVPGTLDAAQAFADWLWAETSGLPFFIDALLQMLVEQGVLTVMDTAGRGYDFAAALRRVQSFEHVPIPPGVRDVILARLARLTEAGSALLLAATVLGRECSFQRLCQVAGMAELTGLPALEALLNGRLLAENGTARRPYILAHDHIREVVYSESGEARRRVLHRRALISLEADGAPAAECAFHAIASLLDEPAFRYSLAAGDEAKRTHALQESLAHYDRARDAVRVIGMGTTAVATEALIRLYQNRGRVLELSQQYEAAQANYQGMIELAETRSDPAMKQAALIALCIIHATHTAVFNPAKARELGLAALDLAQSLSDRAAEARALWGMMLVEFHSGGDSEKVLAYGEKSLSMARELGMKELMGYVLSNLTWAYISQESLAAARKANSEVETIWLGLDNLPMLADTYTLKMVILRRMGEYDLLLATGREALPLSQSIGNVMHESMTLMNVGDIHCIQGRFGQALANYEAAMAINEENGDAFSLQGIYSYMITIHLLAGALERAEQWADKLYALREDFMPIFETFFLVSVARIKIARGMLREGEAILEEAFADFDREGPSSYAMAPLFVADGYLQLALGTPERALDRMEVVIQKLHHTGSRYYLSEALWLQGKAWLVMEKVEQAKEALMEAKAVAEDSSERTVLWQILADLASIEALIGEPEEAEHLRNQARETVAYIADHAGAEELRESFLAQPEARRLFE